MIAVSPKTQSQFRVAMHAVPKNRADLIELRTDFFSDRTLEQLIQVSTLPVILALKQRVSSKILQRLLSHKDIRYVDVDYQQRALVQLVKRQRHQTKKIIVSFHDYTATPVWTVMQRCVQSMRKLQPDIVKVATMIRTVDDLIVIKRLQAQFGRRIIAIGMGELGIMTRLYNRGLLTYAAVQPGQGTAPGQLTVTQLRSMQLYGLIGDDIQTSRSPQFHNAAFHQQHLPHRYQLWETRDLATFMEVFAFFRLPGASITKPYKRAIIEYCSQLDHYAKTIGAVNTLVRRGKKIIGYNTDWIGVQRALAGKLRRHTVLILGTGGAASACAYACQQARADSVICLPHRSLPTTLTNFDVVINATPVANQLLVPAAALKNKIVMDCIYQRPTALLRAARRQQARFICNGLPMLRYQAAEQFKLWTKRS